MMGRKERWESGEEEGIEMESGSRRKEEEERRRKD